MSTEADRLLAEFRVHDHPPDGRADSNWERLQQRLAAGDLGPQVEPKAPSASTGAVTTSGAAWLPTGGWTAIGIVGLVAVAAVVLWPRSSGTGASVDVGNVATVVDNDPIEKPRQAEAATTPAPTITDVDPSEGSQNSSAETWSAGAASPPPMDTTDTSLESRRGAAPTGSGRERRARRHRTGDQVAKPEAASQASASRAEDRASESAGGSAKAAQPGTASVASDDGLLAEIALIERAKTALANGHPQAALAAIREHASSFPRGSLGDERELLQVQALCATGQRERGQRLAADFVARKPNHRLAQRMATACP